jgi:hypothetical protein
MIVLLVGIGLLVALLVGRAALRVYRRRRIMAELRGDWWPRFERDLRTYMSHTWKSAREAERHL